MRLTVYGHYTDFALMSLELDVFWVKSGPPGLGMRLPLYPKSGLSSDITACPKSAMNRHSVASGRAGTFTAPRRPPAGSAPGGP